jgi:ribonuclease VapC
MIAVDTSALMAILLDEADSEACMSGRESETTVFISAGTLTEALIVAGRRGVAAEMALLVEGLGFEVVPVTTAVAMGVAEAYARWGRGPDPAGLNFGDCFAYQTAQSKECPLLYVGTDFSRMDLVSALPRSATPVLTTSGDLFGRDAGAAQIERLFLGLMLTPDAAQAGVRVFEEARGEYGLKGSPIRPDRMHVTLIHVGDYLGSLPQGVIADVTKAAGGLSEASFDVVLDRVASFAGAPGRHPYVLLGEEGVEALKAFRDRLFRALLRAGVRTLSREAFNPHVTLTYGDLRLPERRIAPIRWRPTEFLLIHSEVGRSTYHTLGRWSLRD